MDYRVGCGFDSHILKIKKNNSISLGGVKVHCDYAVVAHSDGDVLLHALSDALLGAACLGDIGMWYSDGEHKNKDMSSTDILKAVLKMIKKNYQIINVDINIIIEHIKIDPIRYELIENLRKSLNTKNINIKAKHYEEPKKEISCQVVVLLSKKS